MVNNKFILEDRGFKETLFRFTFLSLFLLGVIGLLVFLFNMIASSGSILSKYNEYVRIGGYLLLALLATTIVLFFAALVYKPKNIVKTEIIFEENKIRVSSINKNIEHSNIENIYYRPGIFKQGLFISTNSEDYFLPGIANENTKKFSQIINKINKTHKKY